MLQNAPLIVKIGVDTAENEPPNNCEKLCKKLCKIMQNCDLMLLGWRRVRLRADGIWQDLSVRLTSRPVVDATSGHPTASLSLAADESARWCQAGMVQALEEA